MVGVGALVKERKRINAIHLSRIQHQVIQLLVMNLLKIKRSFNKERIVTTILSNADEWRVYPEELAKQ